MKNLLKHISSAGKFFINNLFLGINSLLKENAITRLKNLIKLLIIKC